MAGGASPRRPYSYLELVFHAQADDGLFFVSQVELKLGTTDGDQSDEEVTQVSLGADYKLASASKVYVYGTQLEFDLADEEETIIGLGMEHKF